MRRKKPGDTPAGALLRRYEASTLRSSTGDSDFIMVARDW